MGLGWWLTNPDALRRHVELMAKNQYMSKEERDPVDCSLFYLALNKKKVLFFFFLIDVVAVAVVVAVAAEEVAAAPSSTCTIRLLPRPRTRRRPTVVAPWIVWCGAGVTINLNATLDSQNDQKPAICHSG